MVRTKFKNMHIFSGKSNSIPKAYQILINEINELEKNFSELTDNELRTQSFKLQNEYKETKDLNSLLSRSFALTREAGNRTLGLRHFDVQLLGGLVLNCNKIAEMKTGEGKTLVSTLPSSLNALTKKGVHIVTVNDYLANRDQVSMGQIYRFLGFDTGLIQAGMNEIERQKGYQSDITYVTNYELTFDYLRDNTTLTPSDLVLRPFSFCIIDEIDSILIDEAQTPIILANISQNTPVEKFILASEIVNYLKFNTHYTVDEKNKNVILTYLGSQQVEKIIQKQDLYDIDDPWIPFIRNALMANSLFFNNTHYIIQNNRIVIVDQFTGRIMPDRRWGDGLHQAIEAKEKLPIRPRTETQASITYQNFFLMYPKLAGMTGTGKTSEIEFEKIYNLRVEVIPTYKPTKRIDLPDLLYKDQFSKWNAIAKFCSNISLTGQPLLIGTTTVEKSEMLSQLLKEAKLSYQILNAKPENVRRESEIVAQAGQRSSITIATNMAGRGTDIILGGNMSFQIQKELYDILILAKTELKKSNQLNQGKYYKTRFVKHHSIKLIQRLKILINLCSQKFISILLTLIIDENFFKLSDIDVLRILQQNDRILVPTISYQCAIRFLLNDLAISTQNHHKQEHQIVKNLGGLYVVGTERNDSRRVDNQLRGRCGRQGDPGISRFFVSLDDNLLRLFGGPKIQKFLRNQMPDDSPIESSMMTKSLNKAQKQVEERAYEQRKNLFKYDEILDKQRKILYIERNKILTSICVRNIIVSYAERLIFEILYDNPSKKINFKQIVSTFETIINRKVSIKFSNKPEFDFVELETYFFLEFWIKYKEIIEAFAVYTNGNHTFKTIQKQLILITLNILWKEHLDQITLLRDVVGWRGYGQKDPLTEYKKEAYFVYSKFNKFLIYTVMYQICHCTVM